MKKRIVITGLIAAAALSMTSCNSSDYKKATALYEEGNYAEAAEKFEALGDYEDSAAMAKTSKYAEAKALYDAADYESAKSIFQELNDYEDSASMVSACDYQSAEVLYASGDYEGAITIYESISGYQDADDKLVSAKKELMYQQYGDVIEALTADTWYFNGGDDTTLNSISFTDAEATIGQVYFDGNGKHDNGSNSYAYVLDDAGISLTMADGSTLDIAYTTDGDSISLGDGEYFTADEINADIQGYWTMSNSESWGTTEKNIYFNSGSVVSEKASEAQGYDDGSYYYYGPYEGTYTINFGGFDTEMSHGSEWFFNIIDGKVTVLNYDHICTPSDGLPGEDGYSF